MKEKYTIHTAKYEEKKPKEPEVQTAEKTDVQEALEILLTDSSGSSKKKKSLPEQAKLFRQRLDEMEGAK